MEPRHPKPDGTLVGRPWTILGGTLVGIAWATSGLWFRFSAAWQLVVNTTSSAVLLLMMFLLKERQNRTIQAVQRTIDELLRTTRSAQVAQPDFEGMSEGELRRLHEEYRSLAAEARHALDARKGKPRAPES